MAEVTPQGGGVDTLDPVVSQPVNQPAGSHNGNGVHDNEASAATSVAKTSTFLADPMAEGRRLEVSAGSAIHEPGTRADRLFFIHSGQVRVYQVGPDDSARLLEILGPGDWFGAAALAHAERYGSRAVAMAPTVVSEVAADRWLEQLARHPQVAAGVIKQLAGKLQAAHEDAACLVFDDCNQRLIKTLLHFSRTAAASPDAGGGVVLRITHQQLAQAVGAARETVSLALTNLRQQNLLRTGRNQLFFNPQVLEQFSHRATPTPPERRSEREHERVA